MPQQSVSSINLLFLKSGGIISNINKIKKFELSGFFTPESELEKNLDLGIFELMCPIFISCIEYLL